MKRGIFSSKTFGMPLRLRRPRNGSRTIGTPLRKNLGSKVMALSRGKRTRSLPASLKPTHGKARPHGKNYNQRSGSSGRGLLQFIVPSGVCLVMRNFPPMCAPYSTDFLPAKKILLLPVKTVPRLQLLSAPRKFGYPCGTS